MKTQEYSNKKSLKKIDRWDTFKLENMHTGSTEFVHQTSVFNTYL